MFSSLLAAAYPLEGASRPADHQGSTTTQTPCTKSQSDPAKMAPDTGRRANKLGLAFVGLCPPVFPVGPSACLVASLKYDLPRIILVGTGRRRQNQVRQESSVLSAEM